MSRWGWDPWPLTGGLCVAGSHPCLELAWAHCSCQRFQRCPHWWGWLGPALSHSFDLAPLGHNGLGKESRERCEEQELAQAPVDPLDREQGWGAARLGVRVPRLSWAWGNPSGVPAGCPNGQGKPSHHLGEPFSKSWVG